MLEDLDRAFRDKDFLGKDPWDHRIIQVGRAL